MKIALKLIPLVIFVALAGFLFKGLALDPAKLPSPLIGKLAPEFTVARLPRTPNDPQLGNFSNHDLDGQVWVLNVWASWCGPCVQEHPYLVSLAQQRPVPLVGLNYKDLPEDAQPWLARLGDPFTHLLDDRRGDVGLDWGVYGVPETFVIDKAGKVRFKHVGPVDRQSLNEKLIPIIDKLLLESI
ncbi:MAG: cytochrome c biogenesis protein CcmG/thiol:disulfide interchange protein DsbE [Granulosicoccus sp.]|jgi:cytochrome c biogenesis protein CcmG/thiol:disulfide interchange protein DsbE